MTLLPLPTAGRVYTDHRRVRLGDAAPDRRLRLDAIARFLQDVAEDDAAEAGLPATVGWVLRSTRLAVHRFPSLDERLQLDTFCSGMASRWAERTTVVTGEDGGLLQAVSVWVAVDVTSGAPARLGDRFAEIYGVAAAGRRASARLALPPPPEPVAGAAQPWPLRSADYDVWRHVNNAISWAAVEDRLDPGRWLPLAADVEHNDALAPGASPAVAVQRAEKSQALWLLDGGRVVTSARLRPGAGDGGDGARRGRGDGDQPRPLPAT